MASHAHDLGKATALPLSAVLAAILSYPPPTLARLVECAIERLDALGGDPDLESDPFNEGEPAFDARSRALVNEHPLHDPNGDREGPAWLERIDQSTLPLPNEAWALHTNGEDAEDDDPSEEDDPGGGNVEDEGEPEGRY